MMARKAYMADLRGRVSSAEGPAHVGPDGSLCLAPDCERQLHQSPATRIKAASRNVRRSRALRARDCASYVRLEAAGAVREVRPRSDVWCYPSRSRGRVFRDTVRCANAPTRPARFGWAHRSEHRSGGPLRRLRYVRSVAPRIAAIAPK